MPPLEDGEIRRKLCLAFEERTSNGVLWKKVPDEWVRKNLDVTPDGLATLIYEYLTSGGKVQQVKEDRDGFRQYGFHFDFLIPVGSRTIYVETVLREAKMGPVVIIVNAHY